MATISPSDSTNGLSTSASNVSSGSPRQSVSPKNVTFELLFPDSPQYTARLPMRVRIYPHDTTDSIVTTVKNFYGLYSGPAGSKGVSFEDEHGTTLIARYENFIDNMIVYVRVIEEPPQKATAFVPHSYHNTPVGAHAYYAAESFPLQAPARFEQDISRPNSRTSRRRSLSPNSNRGRRSASASTNPATGKKSRSRSMKNRAAGSQIHCDGNDSLNGYSSGDGAPSSASGRTKEHIGNTEISVENIVEGGRRKRAKFESSELPLFAPPQMPAAASNSSVSPARRMDHPRASIPFVAPSQNPFTNSRPIQSPQGYGNPFVPAGIYGTPTSESQRTRGSIGYRTGSIGINAANGGILPTPDPTVGSCMSEEDKDVAMQLMRLGDTLNVSNGRQSASTLDDTFSGKADVSSSAGATSDAENEGEDEAPAARRQRLDESGASRAIYPTTQSRFIPVRDEAIATGQEAQYHNEATGFSYEAGKPKNSLPPVGKPRVAATPKPVKAASKLTKVPRPSNHAKAKKTGAPLTSPMSPSSLPPSRKQSVASAHGLPLPSVENDQLDLSTKPRCQRCRKSKKGCDRQRPCGRCKDAGLSAEQCVSEDEGNGRKGRYGRHMGVPIRKEDLEAQSPPTVLPPLSAAPLSASSDKSKKRKR